MTLWQRLKQAATRLWRKLTHGATRPSPEFVAGANSGAALGRVFLWAWISALSFTLGLPVTGMIAAAVTVWEAWLALHVFRQLSAVVFFASAAQPATSGTSDATGATVAEARVVRPAVVSV